MIESDLTRSNFIFTSGTTLVNWGNAKNSTFGTSAWHTIKLLYCLYPIRLIWKSKWNNNGKKVYWSASKCQTHVRWWCGFSPVLKVHIKKYWSGKVGYDLEVIISHWKQTRAAWHCVKVGSSLGLPKKREALTVNLGQPRPVSHERRWKHKGGLPTANTGQALSNIPISDHCHSTPLHLSTHSNSAGPECEFGQNSSGSSHNSSHGAPHFYWCIPIYTGI